MEKINLDELIEEYFKKNRIETIPTSDKEKLKLIKEIILETKIVSDQLEFNYDQYREWYASKVEKTEKDRNENIELASKFNNRMSILDDNIAVGLSYKLKLDDRIKQRRKNSFISRGIANVKGLFNA